MASVWGRKNTRTRRRRGVAIIIKALSSRRKDEWRGVCVECVGSGFINS